MSVVQYDKQRESVPIRVRYDGTETVPKGAALCFDRTAGTASEADDDRNFKVVKPATGNLSEFAGIATEELDGPGFVDVISPEYRGVSVTAWTKADMTINETELGPVDGEWFLSADSPFPIARALQTDDTSSTTAEAQVLLLGGRAESESEAGGDGFLALGRASAALPTDAIWGQFAADQVVIDMDFRSGESLPPNLMDTGTTLAFIRGSSGEGALELDMTGADDTGGEVVFQAPVECAGDQRWALEARIKAESISDTVAGFFIGLMAADAATGDLITDAGALSDVGAIGFQNKEADGDILDLVYDEASETQNEHDANWATIAADTYVTVGLVYDGSTITPYLNGVATGDAISAADIAASDFPEDKIMNPVLLGKLASTTDKFVALDWIRFAVAG